MAIGWPGNKLPYRRPILSMGQAYPFRRIPRGNTRSRPYGESVLGREPRFSLREP
jgi:hypothetical protein